jgi:hypothetical protein
VITGLAERFLPASATQWNSLVKVVHHPFTLVLSRLPVAAFIALVAAKASEAPKSSEHFGVLLDGIARNTTMLFVGAL